MGAGRPWAGLPEIGGTWGDVTRGVAKVSVGLPPQTPALRPKHRVPGRGRGRSGSGRGPGAVCGRRAGRGNRGSPREGSAQPGAGLLQKTTCSFLGCLRLLKHTYSHTPGTATPTYGCRARWPGEMGLLPAPEAEVTKKGAPTTPCHKFNTIHPTPPHTK